MTFKRCLALAATLLCSNFLSVADVDVSAQAVTFHVAQDGSVQVEGNYGVWHDEGQADYSVHVALRQIRDGVVIATLWSVDHSGLRFGASSSCRNGCNVQSCTGSCSVGGATGKCKTMIENCDSKDGYRECLCNLPTGRIDVLDLVAGDLFELSVEPVGADDIDAANNTLRIAYN